MRLMVGYVAFHFVPLQRHDCGKGYAATTEEGKNFAASFKVLTMTN